MSDSMTKDYIRWGKIWVDLSKYKSGCSADKPSMLNFSILPRNLTLLLLFFFLFSPLFATTANLVSAYPSDDQPVIQKAYSPRGDPIFMVEVVSQRSDMRLNSQHSTWIKVSRFRCVPDDCAVTRLPSWNKYNSLLYLYPHHHSAFGCVC